MTPYNRARAAFDAYCAETEGGPLQARLARWSNHNFPGSTRVQKALGVAEELGELAEAFIGLTASAGRLSHAVLKTDQGIRGFDDRDTARAAVADAAADIVIFLMQVCTCFRIDLVTLVEAEAERVMRRDWKTHPDNGGTE